MENNDNESLIPKQRLQGKTVQTILIKKNELKPLKCLFYLRFLIRYKRMQRYSFLLIKWNELHTSY